MIMIIIPTKQISKLKMNTLTMKIAMTRLLSKKHQKHFPPKRRRKNKKVSWTK